MRQNVSLLISEPPLQVLPSLAATIGLNEAVILQQIHYLVNSGGGRVIDGEQWIFDTYEELQRKFFPFFSVITLKRTMLKMESSGWLVSCQPEGVMSRRKYYRLSASCYINLTTEKYSEAIDSRRYQNDTMGVSKRYLPLTENTSENSEHKNTRAASGEAAQVCPSASKPAKARKPTWPEVVAEAKRLCLPVASVKRFWLTNQYHGWCTKGRPMKCWEKALSAFVAADQAGKGAQQRDKTSNAEFWDWVNDQYPEHEDREHVNAWVRMVKRDGYMKTNRITGERELISDYRSACAAFVNECNEMGIQR